MILENKFTALDTVRLLDKNGMEGLMTRNAWVNAEVVRPEIYEKHPGLSDCGYSSLCRKWGGPYRHGEVYMKVWHVIQQCPLKEFGHLPAPTLGETVQWLIENKNVCVSVQPAQNTVFFSEIQKDKPFSTIWSWNVTVIDSDDRMKNKVFSSLQTWEYCASWENALGEGLFVAAWLLSPSGLCSGKPGLIKRIKKALAGHRKFISRL